MHPHLAADVGQNLVTVVEFDTEHRVREGLHNGALELDRSVLLRHTSTQTLRFCELSPAAGTAHPTPGHSAGSLGRLVECGGGHTGPNASVGDVSRIPKPRIDQSSRPISLMNRTIAATAGSRANGSLSFVDPIDICHGPVFSKLIIS